MNIEIWLDKKDKVLGIVNVVKENEKAIHVTRVIYKRDNEHFHMKDVFTKRNGISQVERFNYDELKNNETVQEQFMKSLYELADLETILNDGDLGLAFSKLILKTDNIPNIYKGFNFYKTYLMESNYNLLEETAYVYTDDGVYKGNVPIMNNMNVIARLNLMNSDSESELMTVVHFNFKRMYSFLSKEVDKVVNTLKRDGIDYECISLPCVIDGEKEALFFNRFEYTKTDDEEGIAIIYGSKETGYSRPYFVHNMDDRTILFELAEYQTQLQF